MAAAIPVQAIRSILKETPTFRASSAFLPVPYAHQAVGLFAFSALLIPF
jgi:hypothetical protein